jgi:hypothetical protein
MHLLGFIKTSSSKDMTLNGGAVAPTMEEEQLSDLWKCLNQRRQINRVRYQTLFLAVAAILNLKLPEMLQADSEHSETSYYIISLDPMDNAYFRSFEDIGKFHKRFGELALNR